MFSDNRKCTKFAIKKGKIILKQKTAGTQWKNPSGPGGEISSKECLLTFCKFCIC